MVSQGTRKGMSSLAEFKQKKSLSTLLQIHLYNLAKSYRFMKITLTTPTSLIKGVEVHPLN